MLFGFMALDFRTPIPHPPSSNPLIPRPQPTESRTGGGEKGLNLYLRLFAKPPFYHLNYAPGRYRPTGIQCSMFHTITFFIILC
jgi:hypothetical protein